LCSILNYLLLWFAFNPLLLITIPHLPPIGVASPPSLYKCSGQSFLFGCSLSCPKRVSVGTPGFYNGNCFCFSYLCTPLNNPQGSQFFPLFLFFKGPPTFRIPFAFFFPVLATSFSRSLASRAAVARQAFRTPRYFCGSLPLVLANFFFLEFKHGAAFPPSPTSGINLQNVCVLLIGPCVFFFSPSSHASIDLPFLAEFVF